MSERQETRGGLWRRWVGVTTTGELLGFTVPAIAGALTATAGIGGLTQAGILVAAGAVEGAMLGWSQAIVLRRLVVGLRTSAWVVATAVAAMLAYAMGMLPSLVFPLPVPMMVAVGAVAGTVLLGSIGTAQWLVLRRYREGTGWWIAVTAGAWVVGLLAFLAIATPLWRPGQSAGAVVAVGALADLVMATAVAAVTGAGVFALTSGALGPARRGPAGPGALLPRGEP